MCSISFLRQQYEDFRKEISVIKNDNKTLTEEKIALKLDLQDPHRKLSIQEKLLDDAEQYSRRDCLEIGGIPIQESEENTNSIVQAVGYFIGVPTPDAEISVSHPLSVNRFATRTLAIVVLSRDKRLFSRNFWLPWQPIS